LTQTRTGGWLLLLQHPSVRLSLDVVSPGWDESIPSSSGVYLLVDGYLQRCYAGQGKDLAARVPRSLQQNLPTARHVVTATPLGVGWDDQQRLEIEARLIRASGDGGNRASGSASLSGCSYLAAVADEVLSLASITGWRPGERTVPTQGSTARALVLTQVSHPYTVGDLVARLRDAGWSASGKTVGRTLRRDLRDGSRGGRHDIAVTGAWTDPTSLVYVVGRRYASGWRESAQAPGTDESRRPDQVCQG